MKPRRTRAGSNRNENRFEEIASSFSLLDEKTRAGRHVERLIRFGERMGERLEVEDLGGALLEELSAFLNIDVGAVFLRLDGDSDERLTLVTAKESAGWKVRNAVVDQPEALRDALERLEAILLPSGSSCFAVTAAKADRPWNEAHIPLTSGGRAIGVISIARRGSEGFGSGEIELAEYLSDHAALAFARALALKTADRLAGVNQALLDGVQDAVALLDPSGHPLVMNITMERLSSEIPGLARGDLDGQIELADRVTDPQGYRAALAAIAADPGYTGADEFEIDAGERVFRRFVAPVANSFDGTRGRIVVLREISEERTAERRRTDLLAKVSHELRTPLTSIIGFTELLRKAELPEEERARFLDLVLRESRRLSELVNDYLDLERLERSAFSPPRARFDLVEAVRREVELVATKSAAHDVELKLPRKPVPVIGVERRIAQVLANLLSNATKYSPAGGRIEVRLERRRARARVSVRDEGIGIPRAEQEKIFTKFFRVEARESRRIGGTGLGLALAREIVEAHGGQIGFESVEGEGSVFWFELSLV